MSAGSRSATRRSSVSARHYGLTIKTCVPADPQSKGGSEATVKIAKADLVPTDHNLRPAYGVFGELEAACEEWMSDVNTRKHRATMEPPVIRLAEEHERLHRVPRLAAHGVFRGDPEGQLAVDGLGGRCALLGPALLDRSAGLGPR